MRTTSKLIGLLLFWVAGLSGLGCTKTILDVGEPWDSKEAPFFDDGVDVIKDPQALSGEWAYRQRNWLEGRIQLADTISIVNIQSVQTKTDVEGNSVKRIDVAVVKPIYGQTPAEDLSLVSPQDAPGHELLLRFERHLQGRFILFARWFKNDRDNAEQVEHHFHLSPASEALLDEVETRAQLRIREEAKEAD
jgi:hypothetical protein